MTVPLDHLKVINRKYIQIKNKVCTIRQSKDSQVHVTFFVYFSFRVSQVYNI